MAFQISTELDPALVGLAWMIGRWQGSGSGVEPDGQPFDYGLTIDFAETGRAWLHYLMQWFEADAAGQPIRPLGLETGFWRPQPDGQVEVVIAQPEGVAEIYIGQIDGAKIELRTDLVVRTDTAEVATSGGHRLYGNVESDLMFAYDRGTDQSDLQPYLWARLKRVE
ncbi:MAG: FABP family protein [Propionibacteriaceae bacterium]|jgi:hypothetical protein|nr:FABP family protein [Propionibacteriaceae bacterium]